MIPEQAFTSASTIGEFFNYFFLRQSKFYRFKRIHGNFQDPASRSLHLQRFKIETLIVTTLSFKNKCQKFIYVARF